ncbi:MAG: phytanoyl-CoA dioxygenase family protein [Planctomycetes bacterium]|nr:phytanoyl-CoA dioxygenase family protein [Planctomycetota bacterium]
MPMTTFQPHLLERYEQDGEVTINSPFTSAQIASAATVVDRLLPAPRPGEPSKSHRLDRCNDFFDPELIDLVQHPFIEDLARTILKTDSVRFFSTHVAKSLPQPDRPFSFWEHVDVACTTADWQSAPRRMIVGLAVWLVDVDIDTAPLMYRPGSHRMLAAEMDRHPRALDDPIGIEELPRLDFPPAIPLLARAGQVTALTTAMVHGASVCTGPLPRKVLFINFTPASHPVRANMAWQQARALYQAQLRPHLRVDRQHLVGPG